MNKNYIAYTRISTPHQGIGLDAQLYDIKEYVEKRGGIIVAHYSETASGKDLNRKGLQDAIKDCKDRKATLIVSYLDRLSRSVTDILSLKSIIDFEVCGLDVSDNYTLMQVAALAQKERELISKRTKEALAALKAKGQN